jgi:hypothetical protein
MIATASKTEKEAGEALRAEADALKAEADNLRTAYAKARELVAGLTLEMASLPGRKCEAVIDGNIKEYAEVLGREAFLPAELTIVEIAAARAAVTYWEANSIWSKSYRTWARAESERIGKLAGYPFGTAAGDAADYECENAIGIVQSAGPPLGDAHRNLQALIDQASRMRR